VAVDIIASNLAFSKWVKVFADEKPILLCAIGCLIMPISSPLAEIPIVPTDARSTLIIVLHRAPTAKNDRARH
jgi:hypothetical protein